MSICLCNLSADTALEVLAQKGQELEPAETDPRTFTADASEISSRLGEFVDWLPKPINLLVGSAECRRSVKGVSCHVWRRPIPKGGILRVHSGIYVTSPELTLLQQAGQLHQANLCQMLGRYVGTWTPTGDEADKRAPLTTLERLNAFVEGAGSARGTCNLRLAMAYTCEGAASARETTLQLVMSLPPELHGFNLLLPTMNYEVDLSERGKRICGKESIRVDLCWPDEQFGLEYQGKVHETMLGEDYARWYAARDTGYELWYVAKEQLASAVQMDYIGREVARRLGAVVNEELWPTQTQLQDLLDTLAGRAHPRPVLLDELRRRRAAARRCLRNRSR